MIELTIENEIADVALNRPEKLNALNMPMFKAIDNMINKLRRLKHLRAIIISGNGADFCTGIDVKSIMKSRLAIVQLLWKLRLGQPNLAQRVSVGWRKLPVPVIVAIHGRCWGAGMQVALGGDFRIAAPTASLSIMEGKWGLIPDMGGTLALRENVAIDQAMMLAMTANELTAEQALQAHLITEVHQDPLGRARELASELAARSPDAIAGVKKLYQTAWSANEASILRRETLYQLRVFLGINRMIATKRAQGDDSKYRPRGSWHL